MPRRVHLWVPELSIAGGIQNYSRMLLRGLAELLPGTEIRVLSKNDRGDLSCPSAGVSQRTTGDVKSAFRTAHFCSLLLQQTVTQRPDLAILTHLHFAPLAHALKRLTGLRYWVSAHGIEAWGASSPRMKTALAAAERILPVSRHTAHRLLQVPGLDPARLFVLPNTVDENRFFLAAKPRHLLRRYGLTKKQKVLFTLARLDSRERSKGYDLVLDALPHICKAIPDIHYVLAGRGQDTERIRRRVRQLGLENHVTLTGFLPERDLPEHYALADLFVMPSKSEGFGIVFLEALACGRRVLAGNQDGSREPLLEGELGLLVDPNNAGALAATIIRVLSEGDCPAPTIDPAHLRRRVIEHFGFAAFKARLQALLNS
jgi:glycosyltransferase involved in cell wall biosynthesis